MSDRNEYFSDETAERVSRFQCEKQITSKGRLSSVIQFTRLVEDKEFPLDADDFKTDSEGQVAGLGGGNLNGLFCLFKHMIDRFIRNFFEAEITIEYYCRSKWKHKMLWPMNRTNTRY